jgi:hypothetical protein
VGTWGIGKRGRAEDKGKKQGGELKGCIRGFAYFLLFFFLRLVCHPDLNATDRDRRFVYGDAITRMKFVSD